MPLKNFQITVVGDNTTVDSPAQLIADQVLHTLDFSTPSTAATSGKSTASAAPSLAFLATSVAGVLTGTGAPDLDFSGGHNASYSIVVDGGSPQVIALTTLFANQAALLTYLNAHITGATFSGASGALSLTSNSKGHLSSIASTKTVVDNSLKITDGTNTGVASEKIIFKVNGGSNQTLYFEQDFASLAALMAYIQAHITDATVSVTDPTGHLVLTSNTTGTSSEINITTVTTQSTPTLHFATGDHFGAAAIAAYVASLSVDGGSVQPIVLDEHYADFAALVAALNSQTTGAVWNEEQQIIQVTSSTDGASSELEYSITVAKPDIFIAEDDVLGTSVTSTGATLIWESNSGNANIPQQVQIKNAGTDGDMSTGPMLEFGGPNVTFGEGSPIPPGAAETVPLELFESVYCTAADGDSVDVRVIVTRS